MKQPDEIKNLEDVSMQIFNESTRAAREMEKIRHLRNNSDFSEDPNSWYFDDVDSRARGWDLWKGQWVAKQLAKARDSHPGYVDPKRDFPIDNHNPLIANMYKIIRILKHDASSGKTQSGTISRGRKIYYTLAEVKEYEEKLKLLEQEWMSIHNKLKDFYFDLIGFYHSLGSYSVDDPKPIKTANFKIGRGGRDLIGINPSYPLRPGRNHQ